MKFQSIMDLSYYGFNDKYQKMSDVKLYEFILLFT